MTDVSRNICRIAIVVKLREISFVCGKQSVGTCDFGNPKAEEEIKASFCENFCEKSERFLLAVFCNLSIFMEVKEEKDKIATAHTAVLQQCDFGRHCIRRFSIMFGYKNIEK